MATRMQLRRGTAAQWSAANPILAAGEPGVELAPGIEKLKIGDGTSAWSALPYASGGTGGGGSGAPGLSAYQVAVANGFVGDEQSWLDSLQGTSGQDGADGRLSEVPQNADGTWPPRVTYVPDSTIRAYWMWEVPGSQQPPVGGGYVQDVAPKDIVFDLR